MNSYLRAAEASFSKYLVATNSYPDVIFYDFKLIAQFTYLKWLYFNKGYNNYIPLAEYPVDREFHKLYRNTILKFTQSVYIVSNSMIINITEEILYFHKLKLLKQEEVSKLKNCLHELLECMQKLCIDGCFSDSGKEVIVYYTQMHIPNDLRIIDSSTTKTVNILAFFDNTIIAKDPQCIEYVKQWYNTYLRTANLISISGELNRIEFFNKQFADLENKLSGF